MASLFEGGSNMQRIAWMQPQIPTKIQGTPRNEPIDHPEPNEIVLEEIENSLLMLPGMGAEDPFGLTVSAIVIGEMISSMAPCFALSRMR